jgi:hypothetical protein
MFLFICAGFIIGVFGGKSFAGNIFSPAKSFSPAVNAYLHGLNVEHSESLQGVK